MTKKELQSQVNDLIKLQKKSGRYIVNLKALLENTVPQETHYNLLQEKDKLKANLEQEQRWLRDEQWKMSRIEPELREKKEQVEGLTNLLIKLTNNIHL